MDEQLIEKVMPILKRKWVNCACDECEVIRRQVLYDLVPVLEQHFAAILSPEPAKAPEEVIEAMHEAFKDEYRKSGFGAPDEAAMPAERKGMTAAFNVCQAHFRAQQPKSRYTPVEVCAHCAERADKIVRLEESIATLCAKHQAALLELHQGWSDKLDALRAQIDRGPCCREPWCGGDCTCRICAPDLAISDLEAQLETAKELALSQRNILDEHDQLFATIRAQHAQEIERLGRERGEALSAPEIDGRERSEYMRRIRENRPLDALMYFLRDRRAALNAKKVPTLGQQIDDILEDHWGKSDSHRDKAIIAIVELVQRRAEGSTK